MSHTAGTPGASGPGQSSGGYELNEAEERARRRGPVVEEEIPTIWAGWIMFGSVMMIMLGAFHVIQGIVALTESDYFTVSSSRLAVDADYTTWGWTHLIFGALVAVTGVCILFGQLWARMTGVLIAIMSSFMNLAFLAAYPLWSMMMIGLDVLVVWALTVHGGEMKAARARSK